MQDTDQSSPPITLPNPVLFVSLGPGDPELITLKGLKALQSADLIFHPVTKKHDGSRISRSSHLLRALDIPEERLIEFHLPMNRERTEALNTYDTVCNEIIRANPTHTKICVVAEGDAGFYSSVHYIYEKLQNNRIPVKHIPGIPAFIAAGACAGLHVVSQKERLCIIPGATTVSEIEEHIRKQETVVIMKLSQCIDEVHLFIRSHSEFDYHYFENIGTNGEKYLRDAQEIALLTFPYFSLLIIHRK